jgi:hypothetical protein
MPDALTLPGSIRGLLRSGSPVVVDDRDACIDPFPAVVFDTDGHEATIVYRTDNGTPEASIEWEHEVLNLDLAEATGRAHAAWWLREKYGGKQTTAGPSWWLSEDTASNGWRLTHPSGRVADDGTGSLVVWPGGGRFPPFVPRHAALVAVPSLAGLNPADDRLLPDGSRWVDAEALRRVVLHVAEVRHA